MIRYLTVEAVVAINAAHGGEGAGVRDAAIVEAAVHRPQHSFAGVDAHETVWDKAAALLHGLTRTQGFHDGNKRTAWIATRVFLEINGYPMQQLPPSTAHAVMLAVSGDLLQLPEIAEWLQAYSDVGTGPGVVTALMVVDRAEVVDGLVHVDRGGWTHQSVAELPAQLTVHYVLTIHIEPEHKPETLALRTWIADGKRRPLEDSSISMLGEWPDPERSHGEPAIAVIAGQVDFTATYVGRYHLVAALEDGKPKAVPFGVRLAAPA